MRDHNQTEAAPPKTSLSKTGAMGAITLVRHGEPALSRRVKLDWKGYRDWWAKYEEAGLLEGQIPPHCLNGFAHDARYIYSSTLRRSIETAQAICGDKPFEQLAMLVEAPLPPPHLPSFIKFSPNSSGWGWVSVLGSDSSSAAGCTAPRAPRSVLRAHGQHRSLPSPGRSRQRQQR